VRGRGHVGDFLQQLDVLRALAEFVVAQQRAERSAAEHAILFFVDFLEQRALVELRRALQVPQQLLLAHVQDLDLQHGAGLAVIQQVLQSAPARFQLLECLMVEHLVELNRDQVIDLRDARRDHGLGVL
jgi:hypothetical protein